MGKFLILKDKLFNRKLHSPHLIFVPVIFVAANCNQYYRDIMSLCAIYMVFALIMDKIRRQEKKANNNYFLNMRHYCLSNTQIQSFPILVEAIKNDLCRNYD